MKNYLFLCLLIMVPLLHAEDIRVRISQTTVRATIKSLFDARIASFMSVPEEPGETEYLSFKLIYDPSRFNFYFQSGKKFKLECRYSLKTSSSIWNAILDITGASEDNVDVYGDIVYDAGNKHFYAVMTSPTEIAGITIPTFLLPKFDLGSFREFLTDASLEYFETDTPTYSTDNGELVIGLQTKAGIILIADQFRESGTRTTGSKIGQWNGFTFTEYSVPKVFNLAKNTPQAMRASFDILQNPAEKFFRWNDDNNELAILKTFTANGSLSRLNSKFRNLKTNITMNVAVDGIAISPTHYRRMDW